MNKQWNVRQNENFTLLSNRNDHPFTLRFAYALLICLSLTFFGTSCTKNSDDTQCGTPEAPCETIVTDDSLEI